jgi:imidazolonepropionase
LLEEIGTLAPGKIADMVLWSVEHPAELSYWMGGQPCWAVIRGGVVERTGAR